MCFFVLKNSYYIEYMYCDDNLIITIKCYNHNINGGTDYEKEYGKNSCINTKCSISV